MDRIVGRWGNGIATTSFPRKRESTHYYPGGAGIPDHQSARMTGVDPDQFGACFMNWARSVAELTQGEVVAIDGKTLRRCHDRGQGRAPLHLVSAWGNHLVLGQTRTRPFQAWRRRDWVPRRKRYSP